MMLHPLDVAPFAPTPKKAGDIVIHGHASYRVQDDGSWELLDWPDAPLPDCKAVQRAPLWHFLIAGAGMALVVLIAGCW